MNILKLTNNFLLSILNPNHNITIEIKPNPSRVRDHLANERTFLAWMRTGIALMGFGVVILRLRSFHPPLVPRPGFGWKLGLLFSLVGLFTSFLCTRHYFAVRYKIDQDTYEPGDQFVVLFSITVLLLGAGIIYFFFASSLNSSELVVYE